MSNAILFILVIIVASLLGKDMMVATSQYKHNSMCAKLFLEELLRRTDEQTEAYKTCIDTWNAEATISEYEAQQRCFMMLPTIDHLERAVKESKMFLYKKQGCFETDSWLQLELSRETD